MKNLLPLACIEINEYDLIINAKNQPIRNNLRALRPTVNSHYSDYENNFSNIHNMGNLGYTILQNGDLAKCFQKTAALSDLIDRIIKTQSVTFQHICAYCLYYKISTIDHYVPQGEYPVFSSMPLNLIPCCSQCNSIKKEYWRLQGNRLFIHLYNDPIPISSFLSATLNFSGVNPVVTFTLNRPLTVLQNHFSIIESHFKKLRLLELYKEAIPLTISEIKADVDTARATFGLNIPSLSIQTLLQNKAIRLKREYGNNYWSALAIEVLSNSNQFIQSL